ncbi:MAG: HU family DNA-binding protein [Deltaproteobacteria bacterium]|nr:HU family DNA-binding protein [Deltaproteobacteria bacterium]
MASSSASNAKPIVRADLVKIVAERLGRQPKEVDDVCEALINAVAGAMAAGRRVELRPLGVFEVVSRKERTARNLNTGEPVVVPARRAAKFKPGAKVRTALKGAS